MKVRQRLPNYIDQRDMEFPIHEVNTREEFLALDFVKKHAERDTFDYFSYGPGDWPGDTELMMKHNKDKTFWVIGFVREGTMADLGFPEWKDRDE